MDVQTFTVAELGLSLSNAFQQLFTEDIWVTGEIRNLSRPRSGHVYFDLVEPTAHPGATPSAKFRVTLFSGTKSIVNKLLKRAGNIRMEDGMQIRIRVAIDFYEVRGELYLRMTSIDPTYTLGLMAAERDQLLKQLLDEGLLRANGSTAMPLVPHRIGLVTSRGSAAEADFLDELSQSLFAFKVHAIDTPVQGSGAEQAISEALLTLHELEVDIIAVVRGGGSQTDLVVFDSELVARTIAALPIPVLTGIGHETDRSVADEVAHTAHKTPTACAAALVEAASSYSARLEHAWSQIATRAARLPVTHDDHLSNIAHRTAAAARSALRMADQTTAATAGRIGQASAVALNSAAVNLDRSLDAATVACRRHTRHAGRDIDDLATVLAKRAPRLLDRSMRDLDSLDQRARTFDPKRTLARGWSITRTTDGSVVRSVQDLEPGDTLTTVLHDGAAESTVLPNGVSTPTSGDNDHGSF